MLALKNQDNISKVLRFMIVWYYHIWNCKQNTTE